MEKRDNTIDIAKGICIFLMVLGHTCFYSGVIDVVYLFHMPFFFFVSGFFFSTNENLKDFVENKTKRLLIPMLIYWVFTFVMELLLALKSGSLPELKIGVLWFLLSLWTIFIIAYIVSCFLKSRIWTMMVGVVFMAVAYILNGKGVKLPFHFMQSLFMLPFFLLGMIFYQQQLPTLLKNDESISIYVAFLSNVKCYMLLGIFGTLVLIFGKLHYLNVEGLIIPFPQYLFAGAFSGIFMIFAVSKLLDRKPSFLSCVFRNLGRKSLHILGLHFAMLEFLYFILIAAIIRVEKLMGGGINTGSDIKQNMPILGLLLAIIATYISYTLGDFLEKKWPRLWGKNKV